MQAKRVRRRGRIGGADSERNGLGTRGHCSAWRRWAHDVDVRRVTAKQAVAIQLIRIGIAKTPESALALLNAGEEAA